MKNLLLTFLLLASATGILRAAQNPFEKADADLYTGRFVGKDVSLRLKPDAGEWSGELVFKGAKYTIKGRQLEGVLRGNFNDGSEDYEFTLQGDGDKLTFKANTFTSTLQRRNPLPLKGVYESKRVKLDFQNTGGGINGNIVFKGQQYRFSVKEVAGDLEGVFKNGDEAFKFTLASAPGALVFQTGEFSDKLAPILPPFVNSLGMKFVAVPGTEVMFCIWDVRVQDYRAYADANSGVDEKWKVPGFTQSDIHPVVNVNWNDAKAFCAWLSRKEGKTYRLPTDAEWSVAVGLGEESGGTPKEKDAKIKGLYPWATQWPPPSGAGNYRDVTCERKLVYGSRNTEGYDDGYAETSPVGSFAANQFGLYDMGGNVLQWCEDWYDGEQKNRVTRSGSWHNLDPAWLLSSYRSGPTPDARLSTDGFRVVLVGGNVN
jgi:hypothetical protein